MATADETQTAQKTAATTVNPVIDDGAQLGVRRYFTIPGRDPFDEVEWETRDAFIPGKDKPAFEQKGVEFPKFWSQTATNIVAQKYFRGRMGSPDRERSVKQMIGRIVDTVGTWGREGGYFANDEEAQTFEDELKFILVHQLAAFNSPVWFNVGFEEKPACSACFILSIDDSMESILDWIRREGIIFRGGSGSGVNLSKLRSSKEQLSKGGYASGPVSFMRGADASAGTIKSGGKTRRAAKMVVLDLDHPDIEEFIWCKAHEEEKARVLEAAGYDMSLDSPDWASIQYQNANNSVRATDGFMEAAAEGREWNLTARTDGTVVETVEAKKLLRDIAEAAWKCADPGVQYDTTINKWHTLPNTGRINASNPCSEYLSIDDSACNLASLNLMKFRREDGELDVEAFEHAADTVFLAQEILVGFSFYPTPDIEKNAKAYRQLGLGYANLGALLMARGLPYDSDDGRAYAAAVTALMTGRAYRKSAEIAARMGPFAGYRKNAAAMLGVMSMHRAAVGNIENTDSVPDDLLSACRKAWDDTLNLGEVHGYRNAQATVLAPTGCLVGDSLVSTSRGLVRLRSLGDPVGPKWQPLDLEVATDEGPREASQFYVNGYEQVVSIETGRGYRIQGTPTHRIKVVAEDGEWVWKRFAEIGEGDRVPLMLNGLVGDPQEVSLPPLGELYWTSDFRTYAPRTMTPELAELVGYFMGDGSLHSKGLRFSSRIRIAMSSSILQISALRSSDSKRTSARRRATPKSRSTLFHSSFGGRLAGSRSCRRPPNTQARAGTLTFQTRSCTRTTVMSMPPSSAASSRPTEVRATGMSLGGLSPRASAGMYRACYSPLASSRHGKSTAPAPTGARTTASSSVS